MRKILMAIGAALSALAATATTYTWTGAGDATKWADAANWGGSGIPTGGDTAKFAADAKDISGDFAIGAGVLTIEVASGKEVYLKGVISGEGGIKKTAAGKLHLYNAANTYTGTTEAGGGELWFMSIANIGEPSSFGAPTAANAKITMTAVLYMEMQSNASAVYHTDRPFHLVNGCTFRLNYQSVKMYLDGPITGTGVTWRGTGDIYIAGYVPSTFTGNFGRTDGGTVNLLCPTNEFHRSGNTTVNLSDGQFRGTIADKGVPSGLGAGTKFIFGQQKYTTTGGFYYNGSTSTNCNRDLQIEVFQTGNYVDKRYGGRIRNETAGTCLTMNGSMTLKSDTPDLYVKSGAPWLWVGGVGDGVLTTPLRDNLCLEKEQKGTWTLTGESTTTGRVNIVAGRLDIDGSFVDGTGYDGPKVSVGKDAYLGGTGTVHGTVQMAIGSHLAPGHANEIGTMKFGPAKIWFNDTSVLHIRIGNGTNDMVVSTGEVGCNGKVTVNVVADGIEAIAPGTYTLIQAGSLTTANFVLGTGAPEGSMLVSDAERLRLFVPNAGGRTITWTGATSAAWDTTSENWTVGSSATTFAAGDSVVFSDSSVVTNVSVGADVAPMDVSVSSSTGNYTIGGAGAVRATGTFLKEGVSELTLTGTHSYDLGGEVKAGALNLVGTLDGTSLKVADGAKLDQKEGGVISGDGVSLNLGFGNHYLRGTNTFTGNVMVDMRGGSGTVDQALHLYGKQPLGQASSIGLIGFGTSWNTCGCLALYSGTLVEDVTFIFTGANAGNRRAYFRKANDANNVPARWYGNVVVESGCQPNVQSLGGVLEIGRPDGTNTISGVAFNFRGAGTIKVHSRIDINSTIGRDDGGTVIFYNPDNVFKDSQGVQGYYQLGVANGWCTNAILKLGKANTTGMCGFNLDGFDQTLPGLTEQNLTYANANGQRVIWTPNGKPATLTIANDKEDGLWGSSYGWSYIRGPLSLVKKGAKTFTLDGTNSFSGTTTVEAGLLKASVLGALGGTTNVVMKGGTLQLAASKALNEAADIHFAVGSTGKIQLDDGVQQVVQYLVYDELSSPRGAGTYGSSQSAAANKDDTRFSGTGVLVVRRGGGFSFFIR